MSVCVCIASRGRPAQLRKTVTELYRTARCIDTQITVALDDDDPKLAEYGPWGRAPREISLGAKYNRAASYANAGTTLYVLGVDDAYMSSDGWDRALLQAAAKFEDGIGAVYFGERKNQFCQLPDGMALTKGFIDELGFFCPPFFPFWWHDTWIDEIARLTGRFVWSDVKWEKHGDSEVGSHRTTRMREVGWWAQFFETTRPVRVDKALEMIDGLHYPEYYRAQLKQEMATTVNLLWQRAQLVRDNAALFEGVFGAESEPDSGYVAIKAQAQALLDEIEKCAPEPVA